LLRKENHPIKALFSLDPHFTTKHTTADWLSALGCLLRQVTNVQINYRVGVKSTMIFQAFPYYGILGEFTK
jgi:hypothetical protein